MKLCWCLAAWGRAAQGLCQGRTLSLAWCQGHAHTSCTDGAAPDLVTPSQTWCTVALCLQVTQVPLTGPLAGLRPQSSDEVSICTRPGFHTSWPCLGPNHCMVVISSMSRSGLQPFCTPRGVHTTAVAVPPLERAHTWNCTWNTQWHVVSSESGKPVHYLLTYLLHADILHLLICWINLSWSWLVVILMKLCVITR